jgi:hypothetical protein
MSGSRRSSHDALLDGRRLKSIAFRHSRTATGPCENGFSRDARRIAVLLQ